MLSFNLRYGISQQSACFSYINLNQALDLQAIGDAKRALTEAHNSIVDGRHIRVEQARVNRTLFIGKFGRNLNQDVCTQPLTYATPSYIFLHIPRFLYFLSIVLLPLQCLKLPKVLPTTTQTTGAARPT